MISATSSKTIMILHFGGNQIRGSEICLIHTIDALIEEGYRIILVRKDSSLDSAINNKVDTIIDEPFPEIMFDGLYRRFPAIKYLKSLFRLFRLSKKYSPCVMYCNTGLPCQIAIPISKLRNIPTLCHFHHPAPKRYFYFWLVRFADKLIFPSNFTRSVVADKCGRDGDVIYNAVDIETRFTPAVTRDGSHRQELGIEQSDIVIGQVGALTEHKRPDALVQCFADAYQQDKRLRLILVGSGEMHEMLAGMIKDLDLEDVVSIAGYVPDVLPYYQHVFDINVLASTNEGLGISVIEASACGLPSIVTDCTGLREVVDKDITGLTFAENDLDQLTTDILRLSNEADTRQQMGNAAREKTEKLFSLKQYKTGIQSKINELCQNK